MFHVIFRLVENSGFLGHSACLGCSRCFTEFSGGVGDKNYAGFDRQNWLPRTHEVHKAAALDIKDQPTASAVEEAGMVVSTLS